MQTKTIDGHKVAAAREERRLTQGQLAGLLTAVLGRRNQKVHQTTISKWENNHLPPGYDAWQALAEVLRVDPDSLLVDQPAQVGDAA